MKARRSRLELLLHAWSLGAVLLLLALPLLGRKPAAQLPLIEDAFYSLAAARSFAAGDGLSMDGGSPTTGVQPLWVFLVAPLFAAPIPLEAALRGVVALSILLGIAWALLLGEFAARWTPDESSRPLVRAATIALALGCYGIARILHTGLETPLHLLLLTLVAVRFEPAGRRPLVHALELGLLLGLSAWARLDALLLLPLVIADALRRWRHDVRGSLAHLGAVALALLIISPWFARTLLLEGSWMPSSGRSQTLNLDPSSNLIGLLVALGGLLIPVLPRLPPWIPGTDLIARVQGVAAIGLVAWFLLDRERRRSLRSASVLLPFAAALVLVYPLRFASFYFFARYLSPMLLVSLPSTARLVDSGSRRWPRGVSLAVAAMAGANLLALAATSVLSVGSHGNVNFVDQLRALEERVQPGCRVGMLQSGTVEFFRPDVVNLDGKVNIAALRARESGRLRAYVDELQLDVVIDWPFEIDQALGPAHEGFVGEPLTSDFELWVREGSERCVSPPVRTPPG